MLVPWAIVTALGGGYVRAIGFLVIWGVGQLFRQIIQPKIMGDSIGMEPIPTIVLLFIGYKTARRNWNACGCAGWNHCSQYE